MDTNARIADRLIEVAGPAVPKFRGSLKNKRNAFVSNTNFALDGLTAASVNSTRIISFTDRHAHENGEIVKECNRLFETPWFQSKLATINLKMTAFGQKGRTRVVNRGFTGAHLDLYTTVTFLYYPKRASQNKTSQCIRLLAELLFVDRILLPGRAIQTGQIWESSFTFSVDRVKVRFTVSINNSTISPYSASQIISVYESYDTRFAYLTHFVHRWLQCVNRSHKRKLFSSIPSLSKIGLLVIHFMQYYGILPKAQDLHDDNESTTDSPNRHGFVNIVKKELKKVRSRTLSANVGVLFFLFCDYYVKVASLDTHIACIGSNSMIPKANYHSSRRRLQHLLIFNDVFDDISPENKVTNVARFCFLLKTGRDLITLRLSVPRAFDVYKQLKSIVIPTELNDPEPISP